MKKLDHWIVGLLDCWAARSRGLQFHSSIHPFIHQSADPFA
jgi:hypothetical protein